MSLANAAKKQTPVEETKGSLVVVNLRGLVNTRTPVKTTLEQLSIARRFNSTIVPDNSAYRGMLNASKEHVAWCKVDSSLAEKLLKMHSEKSTGVKFTEEELKENKEYPTFDALAKGLEAGKAKLAALEGMRPFFRLNPPRGGFRRSTRRQHRAGGVLGLNEELPKLIERML
ncbi:MAG: 50S ribosomal protein L30 [Nitrososphaerota archaeon]|jgi:large subunit ribosomal protein L30|nr:50S ribosomal protein L30 [Nitrososphaerota archaeon]